MLSKNNIFDDLLAFNPFLADFTVKLHCLLLRDTIGKVYINSKI